MYFFLLAMHHLKRELGQWSVGLTCQLQKGSGTRVHIPGLHTRLFIGGIYHNNEIITLVVLKHAFCAEISAIHLDSNFCKVHSLIIIRATMYVPIH